MASDFLNTTLGRTGLPVFRLGLSASCRPGERAVRRALDQGVNFVFCYGVDSHLIRVVRSLKPSERERLVIATGAYNYIWAHQNMKKALDKRRRQLKTDWIDVFLFLGVTRPGQFSDRIRDELLALRQDGRVRAVSISTHDRKFAGSLAAGGVLDALMIRYNAAHRGAETEIFPFREAHDTGIIAYTATRWRYLLRRPRAWDKQKPVPSAGDCYRFVFTNPAVDVCLTAPSREQQLADNLAAVRRGPLEADQIEWMREFGDVVHRRAGWFM